MNTYTNYTFFYDGPFSQWSPSEFIIDDQKYTCAEQFMMYKKAQTFGDTDVANEIMKTQNPRIQKQLGRRVRGFNAEVWENIARDVVFRGNMAKFTQSKSHNIALMNTSNTLIVEASPVDRIWGIGLSVEDAKHVSVEQWRGTNWLGQIVNRSSGSIGN